MEWCPGGPAFPEPEVVTTEQSAVIAAEYLERAARELRAGDYTHADVWIASAQTWLPSSTHP
jgi:hypothetical protein